MVSLWALSCRLAQNAVVDRGRDRDELRGAVYRADVDALVSLLEPGRD